jgi:hypothetical protein
MTRDEVIRMALEVGGIDKPEPDSPGVVFLERFAALVAAAEREACAKVAEKTLRGYTQAVTGVAEAIRARGEK